MLEDKEPLRNTLSHGSILSFPDRRPWGDHRYPGNCSGYIYKTLFEHLKPQVVTDPMAGSGTSIAVAAGGFTFRSISKIGVAFGEPGYPTQRTLLVR